MSANRETLLCRYHYDPLDRLADCTPTAQVSSQRFYLKDRLTTEVRGTAQCSIFQLEDQLMAQQQRQEDTVQTTFLATDHHRSVLQALNATQPWPLVYTPYGHQLPETGLLSLLGFNGERSDPMTGHYLLGNGYRAFNPVLMRFNSPDSTSPFGKGGLNAYAYGQGDPVNTVDPTGHYNPFKKPLIMLGLRKPKPKFETVFHGVPLKLSSSRPDIGFFEKPTEVFKNTKIIGPEHELPATPRVDSFPVRETILTRESHRVIQLEKDLAYELKRSPKLNSRSFQKRMRNAWTEKTTHEANVKDYNRDADWVTKNAFEDTSVLFLAPPSYDWAINNEKKASRIRQPQ
ncbi:MULTISPECIES: RHS repeat-associated core domain-containing protein [unclassified Pseudomonas]|uniref:RHS repeat-associated core domain-containing protein n=1 Tax=unclassified Pseudomonas TaxID=196821 RepID=UPI000B83745B|nr:MULTISPECIES: RHS repeat-associated core domain-containing protein [unclassified Pseudomonas]